jgi:magnesium-transporting ATPase (P-type)
MNPQQKSETQEQDVRRRPPIPWWIIGVISFTFAWIFIGISVIIGWRMFWNSPIHPSFSLFGAVAFSSVTAFAIVLSFDIVTGQNLSFEFANLKFTGTSGPVTLWILAFLAIMSTFILADFKGLAQSEVTPNPPFHKLLEPSNSSTPAPSGTIR